MTATYKSWASGDVLNAADVMTYLMKQANIKVASASSEISSPAEAWRSMITGTDREETYDGSAWVRTNHWSSSGRTGFKVRRVAAQTITTATTTAMSFDTEDFDSDAGFAVTSATVTAQVAGLWIVQGQVITTADPSQASLQVLHSSLGWLSTTEQGSAARSTIFGSYYIGLAVMVPLSVADTLELHYRQESGSNKSATATFWGYRVAA